jgi:hypothetical protein
LKVCGGQLRKFGRVVGVVRKGFVKAYERKAQLGHKVDGQVFLFGA